MKLKFTQLFIYLVMIGLSEARAAERREFYNGVRSLGMGGASVTAVNDETALLLNPAALGKLRDSYLTMVDPEIHAGSETQAIVGYDWFSYSDPQAVLDLMVDGGHQSKRFHQGLQLFPSFVVPNFGIGLLHTSFTDATISNAGADFNFRHRSDYALVLGYNFRFWDGRIKIGFNTRIINRAEADTTVPANSTTLKLGSLISEGVGVASDAGFLLTIPWQWLPTLGLVYRDIGNTRYDFRGGVFNSTVNRPETTLATMDAALSLSPILSKKTRMTFTAEYRDINDVAKEKNFNPRFHTGVEWNFSDLFFLRLGANQMFYTAGLEVAMYDYHLQFATYGEDIGDVGSPVEDRRYVAKFSFRF